MKLRENVVGRLVERRLDVGFLDPESFFFVLSFISVAFGAVWPVSSCGEWIRW
jgi:hypothetical protein